ncbi:hypothetical protein [Morganella morganii]|uniref:hypothetical protein n=1 Tax=Morganella morganii TaxID=582 RepID=UPI003D7FDF02
MKDSIVGLTIQGNNVFVDHSHTDWLLTRPEENPATEKSGSLIIYSVFKRKKLSNKQKHNKQQRHIGDNCPILYALKGKEALITNISSIKKLKRSFDSISDKIKEKEPDGFDMVIPMPSSYNISYITGKRFASCFNTMYYPGFLRKISVSQAINILRDTILVHNDKKRLQFLLQLQQKENGKNAKFSLKGIPARFRYIFSPVEISPSSDNSRISPGRILLVDDLLTTGTTLLSATRVVQCLFSSAEIRAACLFSSLSGNLDPG